MEVSMPKRIPTGLKIAVINRMFRKKLDEKAEEMGLTSSQLRVLGTISHLEEDGKHEIHQNDLERTERVSHPAMTKMLQRLEKRIYNKHEMPKGQEVQDHSVHGQGQGNT